MNWDQFKNKTVKRGRNVSTVGMVLDHRRGDMVDPSIRGAGYRMKWRSDDPVLRLMIVVLISVVWGCIFFVIGFN